MASVVKDLLNLVSIEHLGTLSGIPLSTLRAYAGGRYNPSAGRLLGLQKVYSSVQMTRLKVAGFPTHLARRYSTLSTRTVTARINKANRIASTLAKKKDVSEADIREGFAASDGDEKDWEQS